MEISAALVAILEIYAKFCGERWHREPPGQLWRLILGLVSVGLNRGISWLHRAMAWLHGAVAWLHRGIAWLHRAVAWLHRGIVMSCHVRRAMT